MSKQYDSSSIQVLEGLEAVRVRPGMYIGGTDKRGFHHLLWEIVDNSVDEAVAGFATDIDIILAEDSAVVSDNGRGIPFGIHPKKKMSALALVFMTLHAGGKFGGDGSAYKTAGGLHGVGSSVVNALSSEMEVMVTRDKERAIRKYSRGKAVGKLKVNKLKKKHSSGTTVSFTPDVDIFGSQKFDIDIVTTRVKYKAYLTPCVKFSIAYLDKDPVEFCYTNGLLDFLEEECDSLLETPFFFKKDNTQVALTLTENRGMNLHSFANGIPTRDGGTHHKGVDKVLVDEIRKYMKDNEIGPKRLKIIPDDVRDGIFGAVSVFVENPQFQGQTKDRLNNPETESEIRDMIKEAFVSWLKKNEAQTKALCTNIINNAKARIKAKEAEDDVKRASPVNRLRLPGKLADCSSTKLEETEIFIVEGDSAGGSAKSGRDRKTQAVMPVRGKVLNCEASTLSKVLENQELKNLVDAIGCGIGSTFDISRIRYGKVILLMDADVDGYHISILLLTFFFRFMPELIDAGVIYIARPPLYKVVTASKHYWVDDDVALNKLVPRLKGKFELLRFKGLGEMDPKVLYSTTLDPKSRNLFRVTVEDPLLTEMTFSNLMGNKASLRNSWISNTSTLDDLDV